MARQELAPCWRGVLMPLLKRASELPRETYLIVEHTPLEEIPAVRDYVLARA